MEYNASVRRDIGQVGNKAKEGCKRKEVEKMDGEDRMKVARKTE